MSTDAFEFLVGSGNQANYSLAIPNSAGFVGLVLHHQALVLDPGVNSLGASASNAARAAIGR